MAFAIRPSEATEHLFTFAGVGSSEQMYATLDEVTAHEPSRDDADVSSTRDRRVLIYVEPTRARKRRPLI